MKFVKRIIITGAVLFSLSFISAHKFYLSVTEINYSKKDQSIQMLSRIFIDDLESVLEERYEMDFNLDTQEELKRTDEYLEKYLDGKIELKINGEHTPFVFLGKEYDNDVVKCYLEIENITLENIKNIQIENNLLFDSFEEQQNIVHFKLDKHKKSFILIKENNKGLLNF